MAKQPAFTLTFAPEANEHLDLIQRRHHSLLRRAIREQLTYTPTVETKNRKPLDQPAPFEATWELRCGPDNSFRVYYDVEMDSRSVQILPGVLLVLHENQQLITIGPVAFCSIVASATEGSPWKSWLIFVV